MSKFNKLIKKLCPNGIQYKRIWEVTAWDKKFQSVSKEKQKKILKYHHLFSKKLLTFIEETGDVKIITTYESDLWTTEKRASKYMSEGEIVCLPGGGNAIIQYHKGKFITGDNRIATSLDTKVLNNKFLYYVLKNRLDEISTFYRGSGIKHPYMPKILDMLIPIPPIEIQEEIVRILDSFTQLTAELTAELTARNKQYEYYRNKLLTFDELEGGARSQNKIIGLLRNQSIKFEKLGSIIKKQPNSKSGVKKIAEMKKGNIVAFTSGEKKFYVDEWLVDGENIFMNDGGQADSKYFNGKAYYSDHVFAFTSEKVNVKFLYHYLLKMNTEINEKYFRGGGIKNLVKKEFLEMLIPIPHIDIQKRIVHVLDNFEKICEDLNIGLPAEIELRKKQYEYYRDLLLNFPENIVEGGAYSFEEIKLLLFTFETVKVTIGSVLQGLKNETLKKSELIKDGEFPVINSGTSLYGYYDKCNNDGNTITIASRGSNAGHIKYIDEKFWAGGLCYPYRSLNENIVNTKYIYYFLKNKEKHICDELVEKGSIPALNKSTIEQFPITIPSPKIQKRIVHVLDNFEKICEDLNIGLPAEIELRKKQYEYYRDKLLSFK